MEIRLTRKMTRGRHRHALILCLSVALCAALIFCLWPFRATAQYETPCGTPSEKEANPGFVNLVLTEAAAELADFDSILAHYKTPCGTPLEDVITPGTFRLVLTEAAAGLVDRDNILAGGLTMGIASLDSLNARLGVTRVLAFRPGPAKVIQVYQLYFGPLLFGPDMTRKQTCSLISLYQADPNVLGIWMEGGTVHLASAVPPSAWGAIKRFFLGGE